MRSDPEIEQSLTVRIPVGTGRGWSHQESGSTGRSNEHELHPGGGPSFVAPHAHITTAALLGGITLAFAAVNPVKDELRLNTCLMATIRA